MAFYNIFNSLFPAESAKAAASKPTSHSYGIDPVEASDFGETKEQRVEDVRQQQQDLEEEDDEDGLC